MPFAALPACAGAGAACVSLLPRDATRPLLPGMLVYTLAQKDSGAVGRAGDVGRRELAIAGLTGGAIGFHDGFFGPGTGSFLIFLFIRFFGLDFMRASASAKMVNIATNLAALSLFVPTGHMLWSFALPMATANVAGAVVGTRLALRSGTAFIRTLFVKRVLVLIAKMGWDQSAG